MDTNIHFLSQLYKSRNQLIYYLNENGYDCTAYEHFSMEELDTMNKFQQLDMTVTRKEETCLVKYLTDSKKIQVNSILQQVFIDEALLRPTDTLVLITNDYTEESVHRLLKNAWELDKYFVVVFHLKQLQFNLLKHKMVPKHVRLTKEEKEKVYETFHVHDDSQMPQISRFEPVAKVLLLRPGEVCKIQRYDKISFENLYYRVCV